MSRYSFWVSLIIVLTFGVTFVGAVSAHQPYFEDEDATASQPWTVPDPTISTAMYATLETQDDVDYFVFEGQAGQAILLEITIPQIEGQDLFAPAMALLGPGLSEGEIPDHVILPDQAGAYVIPPLEGPAKPFFEPFSRTSYWERQEEWVTLPASGQYVAAVWHPDGEVGRYVFVIGNREIRGGDPAFSSKRKIYWTPVEIESETAKDVVKEAADSVAQPNNQDRRTFSQIRAWLRSLLGRP